MNDQLDLFQESLDLWENEIKSTPTREADFDTLSGEHQKVCYFQINQIAITWII